MSTLNELSQAIQKGRAKSVQDLVPRALEEGLTPRAILEEGLLAGMGIVGEQFKAGAMFVPQVLMAAKAMNAGAVLLKPHLAGDHVAPLGRACLGTVKGDLHDIGKNLVRMMFEGQGIEVIDLGVDVSPETFIRTAAEQTVRSSHAPPCSPPPCPPWERSLRPPKPPASAIRSRSWWAVRRSPSVSAQISAQTPIPLMPLLPLR